MRTTFLVSGLALAGCTAVVDDSPLDVERGAADSTATTSVCWEASAQTISGFGASSAWTAPDLSEELANELFSPERIGLSLLRLRIAPNGTTSEVETARKAQARGAMVWASPWSPPGVWKTSGTDAHGGSLLPQNYPAWAERLATFVRAREDEGIHIDALSVQNEPDFVAAWETCEWEPSELAAFVSGHLVPALDAQGVSPRLLAPESSNWGSVRRYGETLLADPVAGAAIGIVATHSYGNTQPWAYRSPGSLGKELWMTEWSDPTGEGPDAGMTSGLVVARAIHDNLTVAEVNAWHYWWLVERSDTEAGRGGLIGEDVVTRRAYVVGQYSHFVRPGSTRVRLSSPSPQRGVFASAFVGSSGDELTLVVINENATPVTQAFDFTGAELSELDATVTNDELALEAQGSVPGGGAATLELSPRSVTTFTGSVSPSSDATTNPACAHVLPRVIAPEESDATGCSCRQAGRSPASRASVAFVGLLGVMAAFRRARARAGERVRASSRS
ncbi:MAG TPA: glycoside hydrolase [Polyangiaceae bacterium]|nr:glycoside hydrolase [Polyangiaceae bacterium]